MVPGQQAVPIPAIYTFGRSVRTPLYPAHIINIGTNLIPLIKQIASGLLLSSFDAHYRNITTISFLPSPSSPPSPFLSSKPTYPLVLTTSSDSSIHLYSLARLLDNAPQLQNVLPEPVGLFRGHTLGVTCVAIGKGGGRVWTGGEDGTVRVSLS